MSNVTDKELKSYYLQISRLAVCDRRKKKAFLLELKENIEEFVSESPEASLQEIEKLFGTPEVIAESLISNTDSVKIRKQLGIKRAVLACLVIALVIYALFVVVSLIDVHTEAHGYFEEGLLAVGSIIKGGGWQ